MGKKPGSQSPSSTTPSNRPKLYVLASAPATLHKPHTTEWSLELCAPPQGDTAPPPSSRTSSPGLQTKHGLFSLRPRKHEGEPTSSTSPPSETTHQQPTPLPHSHYYFSRLTSDSYSVQNPPTTILKIFLCSPQPTASTAPSQRYTTRSNSSTLTTQLVEALSPVHMTPDSASWLRQALFALQVSEIIPGVSHGLDVNKFMGFATVYLDQQIRETKGDEDLPDNPVKQVNYSKIARGDERLRGRLGSDATDYAAVNAPATAGDSGRLAENPSEDVDEDLWNVPVGSAA